ncbi:MAG: hypothetical protein H8D24_07830 [Gammaproteobacteria bacterium]|uniref:Secreted protein n=1 Tax=Candidatus Thiopontia autotrophica TaxID=2841688 RepID=A0A8J6PC98_9GAMM|nr:hypothetical protein [Candidatus Thiopontia autotrophica]
MKIVRTRIRISTVAFAAGVLFSGVATAQWLGPWGSGNDLATAWGLETDSIDDPDEGPGETIDYGASEKAFGMSVQSGAESRPPVVTERRAAAPPPPVRTERPRIRGNRAGNGYRRAIPPQRYRNYRQRPPVRPAPYYAPRRMAPPPRRMPMRPVRPLSPYPYYRR